MSAIVTIISVLQWLLAVPFFEVIFAALRPRITGRVSKLMLARLCWTVLGLLLLLHGLGGAIQFFLGLLPIALSHIHLIAGRPEADIVSLKEVLSNIPATIRAVIRYLKPFLR